MHQRKYTTNRIIGWLKAVCTTYVTYVRTTYTGDGTSTCHCQYGQYHRERKHTAGASVHTTAAMGTGGNNPFNCDLPGTTYYGRAHV